MEDPERVREWWSDYWAFVIPVAFGFGYLIYQVIRGDQDDQDDNDTKDDEHD